MRGTWREGSFTGNPKRYVKQSSGMGVCFHKDRSFLRAFEIKRYIKRDLKMPRKWVSLSIGAPFGNLEGIHLPALFERRG
jgi:hypothetical protein